MITYTLICDNDHEFGETFDNFDDCQAKLNAKALTCPTCGSKKLVKGLSAPNVGSHAKPAAPSCPAASGCMSGGCAHKH